MKEIKTPEIIKHIRANKELSKELDIYTDKNKGFSIASNNLFWSRTVRFELGSKTDTTSSKSWYSGHNLWIHYSEYPKGTARVYESCNYYKMLYVLVITHNNKIVVMKDITLLEQGYPFIKGITK